MVPWDQVGDRLRRAITAKPVDRVTLAALARIPVDQLAAIEQGRPATVSTAALARLAHVLDLPPTALWSEQPSAEIDLSLRFRHASVPDFFHDDEAIARRAILQARALDDLDALLGRDPLRTWFSARSVGTPPHEDGYARAREVRRVLAGKERLPSETAPLPADLDLFIEDAFGIVVLDAKLTSPRVLAFTAKDGPTEAVAIVINTSAATRWTARRRVDLSHELAHALFDEPAQPLSLWIDEEKDANEDYGATPSVVHVDPVEQRARAFAAELLIPRAGLRELLGPPLGQQASIERAVEFVRRAQSHFLSSTELTAHHLANNGYLPGSFHEQILREVPALAAPMRPRQPVVTRRVHESVDAGVMTTMAAREVLGLSSWADLPWSTR